VRGVDENPGRSADGVPWSGADHVLPALFCICRLQAPPLVASQAPYCGRHTVVGLNRVDEDDSQT